MAAIGVGLGPLFGGLLLNWFSWDSVFLVNVPVAVVAILLAIRLVPDSRDPKPGAFDFVGALLSIGVLTHSSTGSSRRPQRLDSHRARSESSPSRRRS